PSPTSPPARCSPRPMAARCLSNATSPTDRDALRCVSSGASVSSPQRLDRAGETVQVGYVEPLHVVALDARLLPRGQGLGGAGGGPDGYATVDQALLQLLG